MCVCVCMLKSGCCSASDSNSANRSDSENDKGLTFISKNILSFVNAQYTHLFTCSSIHSFNRYTGRLYCVLSTGADTGKTRCWSQDA